MNSPKHTILPLLLLLGATACLTEEPSFSDDKADYSDRVLLDQGWSSNTRMEMYRISEGSQIVPLDWFLALEAPDGQEGSFLSAMESFGFIPDARNWPNPYGLPVGFAQHGDAIGVNCTACHTAEIRIKNGERETRVRIDGAPMQADFARFQNTLLATFQRLIDDEDRFENFAKKVLQEDRPSEEKTKKLRKDVGSYINAMANRLQWGAMATIPGPGRADGIGQATNELLCISLQFDPACNTFNPPTTPGFIWQLGDLEWVQSNGSVHGFSAIGRNVGQALGTYAKSWLRTVIVNGEESFDVIPGHIGSDMDLSDILALEAGFNTLKAPNWRDPSLATLLPTLDEELVAKGEELFLGNCQGCHHRREDVDDRVETEGRSFVKVDFVAQEYIGTDDGFIRGLRDRTVIASPALIDELGLDLEDLEEVNAAKLRVEVIGAAIEVLIAYSPFSSAYYYDEVAGLLKNIQPNNEYGYRAQPLEGIAFTGPFLHNGSVQNLAELLTPEADRQSRFWVGGTTFDTDSVGFVTEEGEANAFLFDTSLVGNSRLGHSGELSGWTNREGRRISVSYGTALPKEDKLALLEYLKSL